MVTTIQVDEKLKKMLDNLKVHRRETYNDLLLRLVSNKSEKVDEESLIETIEILSDPEMMAGIARGLREESLGIKGKTLEEVEKELF